MSLAGKLLSSLPKSGWGLTGSSAGVAVFDTSSYAGSMGGFHINPAGDTMSTMRTVTPGIIQVSLSTPWDFTTQSYVQTEYFPSNVDPGFTDGHTVSEDGLRLYVCDTTNGKVHQFNFSTAFDYSTISYIGSLTEDAYGAYVKPGGDKLFLTHDTYGVREYSLSTAYDLSGATASQTNSISLSLGSKIFFKSDGTRFYVSDDQDVLSYVMTTPWDISTASLYQTRTIGRYYVQPFFKPDGKIYLHGRISIIQNNNLIISTYDAE